MSFKIAALAVAVYLIGTTASFSAPLSSDNDSKTRITVTKNKSGRAFDAGYRAALRTNTNTAVVSRISYDRGYRDAVNNFAPAYDAYAAAPGYVTYDAYGRSTALYNDTVATSYAATSYGAGLDPNFPPPALAVAPRVVPVMASVRDTSETVAYCTARYRSYDAASGTFLANDGYRYACQ